MSDTETPSPSFTSRRLLSARFRDCCHGRVQDLRRHIVNVNINTMATRTNPHPKLKEYIRHQIKFCTFCNNLDVVNAHTYYLKSVEDRNAMLEVSMDDANPIPLIISSINGKHMEEVKDGVSNVAFRAAKTLKQNHESDQSLLWNMKQLIDLRDQKVGMDEILEIAKTVGETQDEDSTD